MFQTRERNDSSTRRVERGEWRFVSGMLLWFSFVLWVLCGFRVLLLQSFFALFLLFYHSSLLIRQSLSLQSLILLGGRLLQERLLSPLALLNLHRISSLLLQASSAHWRDPSRLGVGLVLFVMCFVLALVLLLHYFLFTSPCFFRKLSLFMLDVLCVLLDRQELLILILSCIGGADLRLLLLSEHLPLASGHRAKFLVIGLALRSCRLLAAVLASSSILTKLMIGDNSTFALRLLLVWAGRTMEVWWLFPKLLRALLLRLVAVLPLVLVNILHIVVYWAEVILANLAIVSKAIFDKARWLAGALARFLWRKRLDLAQILLTEAAFTASGLAYLAVENLHRLRGGRHVRNVWEVGLRTSWYVHWLQLRHHGSHWRCLNRMDWYIVSVKRLSFGNILNLWRSLHQVLLHRVRLLERFATLGGRWRHLDARQLFDQLKQSELLLSLHQAVLLSAHRRRCRHGIGLRWLIPDRFLLLIWVLFILRFVHLRFA